MKVDPSHIFISSADLTITYGKVFGLVEELRQNYNKISDAANTSRVLLISDKSLRTALLISACFIGQIPVVVLPSNSSNERIRRTINETGVAACFQGELDDEHAQILPVIKVPDLDTISAVHYDFDALQFTPEKLFAILYTSGTTSEAKAVPIKYRNLLQAAESSSKNLPLETQDEWLLNLPLHHIGGISILIRSLLAGSRVYLSSAQSSTTLKEVLSSRNSLTHASLVPTQLKRLLEDPDFKVGLNFKAILLGGGPIPASVHRLAIQRNIPVVPSFGMTETAAQCIAVPLNEWKNAPAGTSGKPLNGIEISLRQDKTSSSSTLLWIRGSQVFDGYLDEGLNKRSFDKNRWYNTGDYVRIDDNGYLFVEMRRSDRIVTGGENVNPFYVEEILEAHLNITEVGVFGIQDDEWGQVVCAAIVLKDKQSPLTQPEIKEFLSSKIPGFMIPKKITLVDQLPRTASGKLIRNELIHLI